MAQPWTREQELAVLHLKIRFGAELNDDHRNVVKLADSINRSPDAVFMRKVNFDYLDPAVSGGLSHPAYQTRTIWQEYQDNRQTIRLEASKAYRHLTGRA